MKLLSVITINYNNLSGLKKTVQSFVNQKNICFEYIVIDGGSTDGSAEFIAENASLFHYTCSEKDRGIYNAMNKGIAQATGDYLLFMNSGDELIDDPFILEKCLPYLQQDVVSFSCQLRKNGSLQGIRTHAANPSLFQLWMSGLKHQSTFIKRSLFKKYGSYDESFRIAGDYEFWIRIGIHPHVRFQGVNQIIAIFELDGVSQQATWGEEHERIEQMWLPHLIADFKRLRELNFFDKPKVLAVGKAIAKSVKRLRRRK